MIGFRLEVDLSDPDAGDAQKRELVARFLRSAAERIELGHRFGGFHFNLGDSTPGGFAFRDRHG